jgi:hypothetical protein
MRTETVEQRFHETGALATEMLSMLQLRRESDFRLHRDTVLAGSRL